MTAAHPVPTARRMDATAIVVRWLDQHPGAVSNSEVEAGTRLSASTVSGVLTRLAEHNPCMTRTSSRGNFHWNPRYRHRGVTPLPSMTVPPPAPPAPESAETPRRRIRRRVTSVRPPGELLARAGAEPTEGGFWVFYDPDTGVNYQVSEL